MKRTTFLAIFVALASLTASFAASSAMACVFDSDCGEGYFCDSSTNLCRQGRWPDGGCTWDSDCLSGYSCLAGECTLTGDTDDGSCTWDSDCGSGYSCTNGQCVVAGGSDDECTFDSDCLSGYQCNNGECRMGRWPDGGCTWDSDCLSGYECVSGECHATGRPSPAGNRVSLKQSTSKNVIAQILAGESCR